MRSFIAVAALVVLGGSTSGCAGAQPKSELYQMVGHGRLTQGALRVIMRDYARRFPAVLEGTAVSLAQGPTTEKQRRALGEFKASGVPMVQSVLLQADPVAALIDGWVLLYQLRDHLLLSAADMNLRLQAVGTIDGLADEMGGTWAKLTGRPDFARTREEIQSWARQHPLRGSLLARDSVTPLLAGLLGREDMTVLQAAGTAVATLDDAMARLDLYAVSLPREARWQAEAAVADMTASPEAERAVMALNHALELIEPIGRLAGQTSAIVARERAAVLADLHDERVGLQGFLSDERRSMLADLSMERQATLRQADELARGLVDRVFERLQRLLLLAALATLAVVLAAGLVLRGWLSRGHGLPLSSPPAGPGPRQAPHRA
jgi:hypothetical protein